MSAVAAARHIHRAAGATAPSAAAPDSTEAAAAGRSAVLPGTAAACGVTAAAATAMQIAAAAGGMYASAAELISTAAADAHPSAAAHTPAECETSPAAVRVPEAPREAAPATAAAVARSKTRVAAAAVGRARSAAAASAGALIAKTGGLSAAGVEEFHHAAAETAEAQQPVMFSASTTAAPAEEGAAATAWRGAAAAEAAQASSGVANPAATTAASAAATGSARAPQTVTASAADTAIAAGPPVCRGAAASAVAAPAAAKAVGAATHSYRRSQRHKAAAGPGVAARGTLEAAAATAADATEKKSAATAAPLLTAATASYAPSSQCRCCPSAVNLYVLLLLRFFASACLSFSLLLLLLWRPAAHFFSNRGPAAVSPRIMWCRTRGFFVCRRGLSTGECRSLPCVCGCQQWPSPAAPAPLLLPLLLLLLCASLAKAEASLVQQHSPYCTTLRASQAAVGLRCAAAAEASPAAAAVLAAQGRPAAAGRHGAGAAAATRRRTARWPAAPPRSSAALAGAFAAATRQQEPLPAAAAARQQERRQATAAAAARQNVAAGSRQAFGYRAGTVAGAAAIAAAAPLPAAAVLLPRISATVRSDGRAASSSLRSLLLLPSSLAARALAATSAAAPLSGPPQPRRLLRDGYFLRHACGGGFSLLNPPRLDPLSRCGVASLLDRSSSCSSTGTLRSSPGGGSSSSNGSAPASSSRGRCEPESGCSSRYASGQRVVGSTTCITPRGFGRDCRGGCGAARARLPLGRFLGDSSRRSTSDGCSLCSIERRQKKPAASSGCVRLPKPAPPTAVLLLLSPPHMQSDVSILRRRQSSSSKGDRSTRSSSAGMGRVQQRPRRDDSSSNVDQSSRSLLSGGSVADSLLDAAWGDGHAVAAASLAAAFPPPTPLPAAATALSPAAAAAASPSSAGAAAPTGDTSDSSSWDSATSLHRGSVAAAADENAAVAAGGDATSADNTRHSSSAAAGSIAATGSAAAEGSIAAAASFLSREWPVYGRAHAAVKLPQARCLVVGLDGVGLEAAKCLLLGGVGHVLLHDAAAPQLLQQHEESDNWALAAFLNDPTTAAAEGTSPQQPRRGDGRRRTAAETEEGGGEMVVGPRGGGGGTAAGAAAAALEKGGPHERRRSDGQEGAAEAQQEGEWASAGHTAAAGGGRRAATEAEAAEGEGIAGAAEVAAAVADKAAAEAEAAADAATRGNAVARAAAGEGEDEAAGQQQPHEVAKAALAADAHSKGAAEEAREGPGDGGAGAAAAAAEARTAAEGAAGRGRVEWGGGEGIRPATQARRPHGRGHSAAAAARNPPSSNNLSLHPVAKGEQGREVLSQHRHLQQRQQQQQQQLQQQQLQQQLQQQQLPQQLQQQQELCGVCGRGVPSRGWLAFRALQRLQLPGVSRLQLVDFGEPAEEDESAGVSLCRARRRATQQQRRQQQQQQAESGKQQAVAGIGGIATAAACDGDKTDSSGGLGSHGAAAAEEEEEVRQRWMRMLEEVDVVLLCNRPMEEVAFVNRLCRELQQQQEQQQQEQQQQEQQQQEQQQQEQQQQEQQQQLPGACLGSRDKLQPLRHHPAQQQQQKRGRKKAAPRVVAVWSCGLAGRLFVDLGSSYAFTPLNDAHVDSPNYLEDEQQLQQQQQPQDWQREPAAHEQQQRQQLEREQDKSRQQKQQPDQQQEAAWGARGGEGQQNTSSEEKATENRNSLLQRPRSKASALAGGGGGSPESAGLLHFHPLEDFVAPLLPQMFSPCCCCCCCCGSATTAGEEEAIEEEGRMIFGASDKEEKGQGRKRKRKGLPAVSQEEISKHSSHFSLHCFYSPTSSETSSSPLSLGGPCEGGMVREVSSRSSAEAATAAEEVGGGSVTGDSSNGGSSCSINGSRGGCGGHHGSSVERSRCCIHQQSADGCRTRNCSSNSSGTASRGAHCRGCWLNRSKGKAVSLPVGWLPQRQQLLHFAFLALDAAAKARFPQFNGAPVTATQRRRSNSTEGRAGANDEEKEAAAAAAERAACAAACGSRTTEQKAAEDACGKARGREARAAAEAPGASCSSGAAEDKETAVAAVAPGTSSSSAAAAAPGGPGAGGRQRNCTAAHRRHGGGSGALEKTQGGRRGGQEEAAGRRGSAKERQEAAGGADEGEAAEEERQRSATGGEEEECEKIEVADEEELGQWVADCAVRLWRKAGNLQRYSCAANGKLLHTAAATAAAAGEAARTTPLAAAASAAPQAAAAGAAVRKVRGGLSGAASAATAKEAAADCCGGPTPVRQEKDAEKCGVCSKGSSPYGSSRRSSSCCFAAQPAISGGPGHLRRGSCCSNSTANRTRKRSRSGCWCSCCSSKGSSCSCCWCVGFLKKEVADCETEQQLREVARLLVKSSRGCFSPIASLMGGLAAQEALKVISGCFTPIHQFFYFDALDLVSSLAASSSPLLHVAGAPAATSGEKTGLLPSGAGRTGAAALTAATEVAGAAGGAAGSADAAAGGRATGAALPAGAPAAAVGVRGLQAAAAGAGDDEEAASEAEVKKTESCTSSEVSRLCPSCCVAAFPERWRKQESVLGAALHTRLQQQRVFLVGAGAIGCEMMKMMALMGVGCSRYPPVGVAVRKAAAAGAPAAAQRGGCEGVVAAKETAARTAAAAAAAARDAAVAATEAAAATGDVCEEAAAAAVARSKAAAVCARTAAREARAAAAALRHGLRGSNSPAEGGGEDDKTAAGEAAGGDAIAREARRSEDCLGALKREETQQWATKESEDDIQSGRRDEEGCITIADADVVERSNLNRQLLFTPQDVGRFKAAAAAAAAKRLNAAVRAEAVHAFVGRDSEDLFDADFYKQQDVLLMAVDTVAARMYLDSQCLVFQKPLIEAGTLGLRGHAQALIPHLTESYGSTADPHADDEGKPQPLCSIRGYPTSPIHLVEWARTAVFDVYFSQRVNEASHAASEHEAEAQSTGSATLQQQQEQQQRRGGVAAAAAAGLPPTCLQQQQKQRPAAAAQRLPGNRNEKQKKQQQQKEEKDEEGHGHQQEEAFSLEEKQQPPSRQESGHTSGRQQRTLAGGLDAVSQLLPQQLLEDPRGTSSNLDERDVLLLWMARDGLQRQQFTQFPLRWGRRPLKVQGAADYGPGTAINREEEEPLQNQQQQQLELDQRQQAVTSQRSSNGRCNHLHQDHLRRAGAAGESDGRRPVAAAAPTRCSSFDNLPLDEQNLLVFLLERALILFHSLFVEEVQTLRHTGGAANAHSTTEDLTHGPLKHAGKKRGPGGSQRSSSSSNGGHTNSSSSSNSRSTSGLTHESGAGSTYATDFERLNAAQAEHHSEDETVHEKQQQSAGQQKKGADVSPRALHLSLDDTDMLDFVISSAQLLNEALVGTPLLQRTEAAAVTQTEEQQRLLQRYAHEHQQQHFCQRLKGQHQEQALWQQQAQEPRTSRGWASESYDDDAEKKKFHLLDRDECCWTPSVVRCVIAQLVDYHQVDSVAALAAVLHKQPHKTLAWGRPVAFVREKFTRVPHPDTTQTVTKLSEYATGEEEAQVKHSYAALLSCQCPSATAQFDPDKNLFRYIETSGQRPEYSTSCLLACVPHKLSPASHHLGADSAGGTAGNDPAYVFSAAKVADAVTASLPAVSAAEFCSLRPRPAAVRGRSPVADDCLPSAAAAAATLSSAGVLATSSAASLGWPADSRPAALPAAAALPVISSATTPATAGPALLLASNAPGQSPAAAAGASVPASASAALRSAASVDRASNALWDLRALSYDKNCMLHLSFLTAAARLRGRCFMFQKLPDLLAVQQLSGRIVPATATATTVAAALACIELYRIAKLFDLPRRRRLLDVDGGEDSQKTQQPNNSKNANATQKARADQEIRRYTLQETDEEGQLHREAAQNEMQHKVTSYAEERGDRRGLYLMEQLVERKGSKSLQLTAKGANVSPNRGAQSFLYAKADSRVSSFVDGLDKAREDNGGYFPRAAKPTTVKDKQVQAVEPAQALQEGGLSALRGVRDMRDAADFYFRENVRSSTRSDKHHSRCTTRGSGDSAGSSVSPGALGKTTEQAKPVVALQLERNLPVSHERRRNTFNRTATEASVKRGIAGGEAVAAPTADVYGTSETPVISNIADVSRVAAEVRARGVASKYDASQASARAGRSGTGTPVVISYPGVAAQATVDNRTAQGFYGAAPAADKYAEAAPEEGTRKPTAARLWIEALPRSAAGRERARKKFKSSFFNLSAFFLTDAAPLAPPTAQIPGGLLEAVDFTPWDFLRLYFPSCGQLAEYYSKEAKESSCGGGQAYGAARVDILGGCSSEGEKNGVTFAQAPRIQKTPAPGTVGVAVEEADATVFSSPLHTGTAAEVHLPFTEEEEAAAAAAVISVTDVVTLLEETLGVSVSLLTCEDAVLYSRDTLLQISEDDEIENFRNDTREKNGKMGNGVEEAQRRGLKRQQEKTTNSERPAAAATDEQRREQKEKAEASVGSWDVTDTGADILMFSDTISRGSTGNTGKKSKSSFSNSTSASSVSPLSFLSHGTGEEQKSLAAVLREIVLKTGAAAGTEEAHVEHEDRSNVDTSNKHHQAVEAGQRTQHATLEAAQAGREQEAGEKSKKLQVESFDPNLDSSKFVRGGPKTPALISGHVNGNTTQGKSTGRMKNSLGGRATVTAEGKISRVDLFSNAVQRNRKNMYKWVVVDIVCTDQEGVEVIVPQLKVCVRLT